MARLLGILFGIAALAAIGYDMWRGPYQDRELELTSIAEGWAQLHRTSLIGLNSFTEKNLSPEIWDSYVLPALNWPAALTFTVLGLFFLYFVSRSGHRKRHMFSKHGRR